MDKDVSIVVSPREGFSYILHTLNELDATVPPGVQIIVVEGGSQAWVKDELRKRFDSGRVALIQVDYMPTPNEARNIGLSASDSRYVVFVDNDIAFEPGWLEELVKVADEDNADVVGPTICIGPPRTTVVHHAGGILSGRVDNGVWGLQENHRLKDETFVLASAEELDRDIHVVEFHCMLVRRGALDILGPFDERLTSREEKDLALRCLDAGLRVRYAPRSIVTYMAQVPAKRGDMRYLLFRWSEKNSEASLEVFEQTWDVTLNRHKVLNLWIGGHRRRLVETTYRWLKRIYPRRLGRLLADFISRRAPRNPRPASWKPLMPPPPSRSAEELVTASGSRQTQ